MFLYNSLRWGEMMFNFPLKRRKKAPRCKRPTGDWCVNWQSFGGGWMIFPAAVVVGLLLRLLGCLLNNQRLDYMGLSIIINIRLDSKNKSWIFFFSFPFFCLSGCCVCNVFCLKNENALRAHRIPAFHVNEQPGNTGQENKVVTIRDF